MNRYIIPIILVILSASIYVSVIDSTYADIRRQQAVEVELEENLKDARLANERLTHIKELYASFPAGSEQTLSTILPDKIDPIKFIIEMEALARLHGLVLVGPNATVGEKNDSSKYNENKITFSVAAPYPVFQDFLRDIQDSLALREMTSVGFSSEEVSPTNGRYQSPESIVYKYNISITSYSLHP